MAIQEGIGDDRGQGNGLFGLYQIVQTNGGRLTLTSGSASLKLTEDLCLQKYDNLPYIDRSFQGTTVDFQLDLNRAVDIKAAFSSIGGSMDSILELIICFKRITTFCMMSLKTAKEQLPVKRGVYSGMML